MATTIFEGFSVSHAAILDGATGAEDADVYGVRSGSVVPDTGDFDNTGDDAVLSSWLWFNFATVTVTSGFVGYELLALLSGSSITSSGTAPNDYYDIPLWDIDSLNQSRKPVLIRVPSKDSLGVVRTLDFILYSCSFGPITFDGPAYKAGLAVSYTAKAVLSTVNETGAALTKRAIGRLVNKPG